LRYVPDFVVACSCGFLRFSAIRLHLLEQVCLKVLALDSNLDTRQECYREITNLRVKKQNFKLEKKK
jgi:metal-responsive CopG/Arc/MetJ family transcriptional regulator